MDVKFVFIYIVTGLILILNNHLMKRKLHIKCFYVINVELNPLIKNKILFF